MRELKLKLFRGIKELLSFSGVHQKDGRRVVESDLGRITEGCLLVDDEGKIVFVGTESQLRSSSLSDELTQAEVIDLNAACVMPAFVEAHTHLVFAGDRKAEFEMRNQGVSYKEIAEKGGGILSTLKQTRAISYSELLEISQERCQNFVNQGVTCLEVKSGYCLDKEGELKMLKVARNLQGPKIYSTFLGAHALPPEFKSTEKYLEYLSSEVLPEVIRQKLADRVDIFIEHGFFDAEGAKSYLKQAIEAGLKLNIHADQLSLSGGTSLALSLDAQSADHVIQIDENLVQRLAESQTVGMLLPAADFYLKCDYPPARKLIDQGACVAIATDFNPGSSPTQDLSFVGVLARLEMKMTLPEVLSSYTIGAAKSLGLQNERGSLEVGKVADFIVLNEDWRSLFYQVGHHPVESVYCHGNVLNSSRR